MTESRLIYSSSKGLYYLSPLHLLDIHCVPAVINSMTEFKFIRENQHTLSDGRDFFVGGSTNAAEGENIEYFEYQATTTGNEENSHLIDIKYKIIIQK